MGDRQLRDEMKLKEELEELRQENARLKKDLVLCQKLSFEPDFYLTVGTAQLQMWSDQKLQNELALCGLPTNGGRDVLMARLIGAKASQRVPVARTILADSSELFRELVEKSGRASTLQLPDDATSDPNTVRMFVRTLYDARLSLTSDLVATEEDTLNLFLFAEKMKVTKVMQSAADCLLSNVSQLETGTLIDIVRTTHAHVYAGELEWEDELQTALRASSRCTPSARSSSAR